MEIDKKVVHDLKDDWMVQFQYKHYYWLFSILNLVAFLGFGLISNDFLGAFFVVLLARVFLLHHSTWFINSLAHTWGGKSYSQKISAVNNFWCAILTFGEGYHNYHHTFAGDYRNGHKFFHFDPSKWFIWVISKFGLASGLRKMDGLTIEKRLLHEEKEVVLESLANLESENLGGFIEQVNRCCENIGALLNEVFRGSKNGVSAQELKLKLKMERGKFEDLKSQIFSLL